MSGLFDSPKPPAPTPVVDPAQTQNRVNDALAKKLAGGGSNSTSLASQWMSGSTTGGGRAPNLTGLN